MCGDVEHRHEHLVMLIGSLGLLPSAWACCSELLDGLPHGILVALATWHLEPSYAEVSSSQAFGNGDEKCPRAVSIFRYEAAGKGGHVDK